MSYKDEHGVMKQASVDRERNYREFLTEDYSVHTPDVLQIIIFLSSKPKQFCELGSECCA